VIKVYLKLHACLVNKIGGSTINCSPINTTSPAAVTFFFGSFYDSRKDSYCLSITKVQGGLQKNVHGGRGKGNIQTRGYNLQSTNKIKNVGVYIILCPMDKQPKV
jgi:hypothetical protein